MGNQKQQVISRFFAPKPKPSPNNDVPSSSSTPTPLPSPPPKTPPPKIAATVTFSPFKRQLTPPLQNPKKRSKPTPSHQQQQTNYTPLEQQVVDLKSEYPDVLLMIEVGYKYRFFGEDAEIAARVLGIYAHQDRNFMTASVPSFRLNVHVRRLVNSGYKVGVVKQTETAAIKAHGENKGGPFCRGLSALYTKATLEAAEDMGGSREEEGFGGGCNYLVCVVEKNVVERNLECWIESGFDVKIGIVAVEVSTGEVVYGEFHDNAMRTGLEAVVLSLCPAELLLGEPLSSQTKKLLLAYAGPASNVRVEHASRDCYDGGGALAEVITLFDKMNGDSASDSQKKNSEERVPTDQTSAVEVIMNMPDLAVQALALAIRHLKQFGFERILCLGASFRPYSRSMEMSLSANALQQLEVLRNNSDGSEAGSLLQVMNHTLTAYGSRLLRHWVTHPLCDKSMISARLDAVAEIAETMGFSKVKQDGNVLDQKDADIEVVRPELYALLSSMLTYLGRSPDLHRGTTRIFYHTATTSEFIAVMQAILYAAKQLKQLNIEDYKDEPERSGCFRSVLLRKLISTASSSSLIANCAKLLSAVNKEAAEKGDFCNLIINGDEQFSEVVRSREAVQLATDRLNSLIVMFGKQLGMHNIKYISVSGVTHLIELPVDVKVPLNWVKVNSTKKTIRYHPPEVLIALDQLTLANEKLMIACRAAWDGFLEEFAKYYTEFQAAIQALATLDCLHSLAILSKNKNYVRPYFVDDDDAVQIHIHSGRHPVLETLLQDNFVPNDTNLHGDKEFCQIVTGPNMGGKSCYIRQVALIVIMAQVGSFVPASSAKLHVLDGIYTRMGASDSIQQGRSTFLEELTEASLILRNCTVRSLVIIDELGRGTSTHDGVAIAYATLHHLINQKRCMILFVTHYPKVAEIQSEFPGSVGAYHVSYLASSKDEASCSGSEHEDVTYLYKLKSGVSEKSFGFNVAQLAQVPLSCINRAVVMSSKLDAAVRGRITDVLAQRTVNEYQGRGVENTGESTIAFKEIFSNLKSALEETDVAKSFELLSHARSLAKELTSTT